MCKQLVNIGIKFYYNVCCSSSVCRTQLSVQVFGYVITSIESTLLFLCSVLSHVPSTSLSQSRFVLCFHSFIHLVVDHEYIWLVRCHCCCSSFYLLHRYILFFFWDSFLVLPLIDTQVAFYLVAFGRLDRLIF